MPCHPSNNGKACKEVKGVVCLETSNSAFSAWKTGLTKHGKGMFFHHMSHLRVTSLIQSHSAAGFVASSTELDRISSSAPLCTHRDVNTALRFGEGRSPSITAFLRSLCGSWAVWVVPYEQGTVQSVLVSACVQTLCSSPLGWGLVIQYKCFPGA